MDAPENERFGEIMAVEAFEDAMERATSTKMPIALLDTVALLKDLPNENLRRGQVGTVVELLAPGVFEVEFVDNEGRTYAMLALSAEQLMVLHHQPAA